MRDNTIQKALTMPALPAFFELCSRANILRNIVIYLINAVLDGEMTERLQLEKRNLYEKMPTTTMVFNMQDEMQYNQIILVQHW